MVAVILAFTLGVGWSTALIMSASSRTPPITDSTKDLLSSVGGVLAGVLAAFVGGVVGRKWESKSDKDEEPPEL